MDFEFLKQSFQVFQGHWGWIAQVFVVVFGALLLDMVQKRILRRLQQRFATTASLWDDALVEASLKPLSLLIWLLGIAFAAEIVGQATEAPIFALVGPLRDIGVVAIIAWALTRLIHVVELRLIARQTRDGKPIDRTTVDAVSKLLRVTVFITASLIVLQTLGFSVSGVLAFGGIGGIAVGFAAKDLLANFFGGLMIYLDRPFSVGDWIRSPDREMEGTVEKIGWRQTKIRTFDKRPLYVPNATFTSVAVENPSRMSHRRIFETIGLRYADADKIRPIVAEVRKMLTQHEEIDESQTLMVNFTTFGASSLDFFIYCFTHTTVWTEYHRVKEDVLLRIHDIIAAHGAEIAFPTSTVHVPDGLSIGGASPLESAFGQAPEQVPEGRPAADAKHG